MSYTAAQILDAIAPSLGTSAQRSIHLGMAAERTSDSYGARKQYAIAYRAAHELTLLLDPAFTGGGGASGVASKKEGDLSISYFQASSGSAVSMSGESDLALTSFGRRLIGLAKANIVSFGVTGPEVTDYDPVME